MVPPLEVNRFQCKYNSDNEGFILKTSFINFAEESESLLLERFTILIFGFICNPYNIFAHRISPSQFPSSLIS